MNSYLKWCLRGIRLFPEFFSSRISSGKNRDLFKGVEYFCVFLGYPRSGHSIVGSLLDAHPHITISHALGVLKYVNAGFNREQLFHLIVENARNQAVKGRRQDEYDLSVPGQYQGDSSQIRVIGDKRGSDFTLRLGHNPDLLKRLQELVGLPVKMIHMCRNPCDNIATMLKRADGGVSSLEDSIGYYHRLCRIIDRTRSGIAGEDLMEFTHEAFIEDPAPILEDLCRFLGQKVSGSYLEDCTRVVFKKPRKTRFDIPWSRKQMERVSGIIKSYEFLEEYAHDTFTD